MTREIVPEVEQRAGPKVNNTTVSVCAYKSIKVAL